MGDRIRAKTLMFLSQVLTILSKMKNGIPVFFLYNYYLKPLKHLHCKGLKTTPNNSIVLTAFFSFLDAPLYPRLQSVTEVDRTN